MNKLLRKVRKPVGRKKKQKDYMRNTVYVFLLGLGVGLLAHILDFNSSHMIASFEFGDFLLAVDTWFLVLLGVSIYSYSSGRATMNALAYTAGVVLSFIVYSLFGTFSSNVILSWVILLFFSPVLGFIGWYAFGKGQISEILSGVIMAFFLIQTFDTGFWYIHITSLRHLLLYVSACILLYRDVEQFAKMILYSLVFAFPLKIVGIPLWQKLLSLFN